MGKIISKQGNFIMIKKKYSRTTATKIYYVCIKEILDSTNSIPPLPTKTLVLFTWTVAL